MAAYAPTTWVNYTSPPLSAANLNKLTDELKSQAAAVGTSQSLPTWADGAAPAITDAAPWNEMERITQVVAQAKGLGYTPTTWQSGWTPARNAARLNALELQVKLNRDAIDAQPSGGTVLFNGDVEAGTIVPPWDIIQQWTSGRATVQTQASGGLAPRVGTRYARLQVNYGDNIYGGGTDACQVIRADNIAGHYQVLGDDTYQGFSMYFASASFSPCISNPGFNNCYEWHGNTSSVYAPVSIIINANAPAKWQATLHTVPDYPNFHPRYFDMLPFFYDEWVDFVFHIKWSQGADGKLTAWQKRASQSWGAPVFDYTGQTWYIGSNMTAVKPQLGYYREQSTQNPSQVYVYLDGYKIGTTFAVVAA